MSRAILCVLDSVGIGGAPDAAAYGDEGSCTVGNIARACAEGRGDQLGLRSGPLKIPNLIKMGIGAACAEASGSLPPSLEGEVQGIWGYAFEISNGKDTSSGHWEISGAPVDFEWAGFPDETPAFPAWLTEELINRAGLSGILGNCHASGSQIIDQLAKEHIETGKPICYTSVDSVLQIAAHEETFGLERLMDTCKIARELTNPLKIGRVIARPFMGNVQEGFTRTTNRRDFSIPPPSETLLDYASSAGRHILTLGKVADIFAHRNTGENRKAINNMAMMDNTLQAIKDLRDGGLIFANFIDFDMDFGHRRDIPGYAHALEIFDARIPELLQALAPDDLLILTADHGNDPTWSGTNHTREQVPILAHYAGLSGSIVLGQQQFSNIGASIADHLGLPFGSYGTSFLNQLPEGK